MIQLDSNDVLAAIVAQFDSAQDDPLAFLNDSNFNLDDALEKGYKGLSATDVQASVDLMKKILAIGAAGSFAVVAGTGLAMMADVELGSAATTLARPKPPNLPSWKKIDVDIEHILSGHTSTGARAIQSGIKDLFPSNMTASQIEKAIINAYRYGQKVATQGDSVLVRGPFGKGQIEMWVNKAEKLIETAYPIP